MKETNNTKVKDSVESCDSSFVHEEIVRKVEREKPIDDRLIVLSNFFKVVGDKTRIQILWCLNQSPMCVCDLSYLLNMSQSAISHQLAVLKKNNLVKARRDGRIIHYSLSDDHVKEILDKGLEHILEMKESEI